MRVPISWLKEYVDITIPVEELAHRLTLAGLEVSNIEYLGIPAGDVSGSHLAVPISTGHLVWDREKIAVGHILEVKAHPNADRLVLAMVDSGIGEVETVVTGAPNLFPYKDQGPIDPPLVSPYAREGAEVIDGHKDDGSRFIIKERELRGIPNRSMVCSEKELGISDEHEGIMLIESDAPPGTPLQDVLGDVILDIDLTPNLARCFSMVGVAREVAALAGQKLHMPPTDVVMEGASIEGQARIDIRVPEYNPRFAVSLIKGVEIRPSPWWMQWRLRLAGMRPISNIVDVTNYVMLEMGQPLHAFDYDRLVARAGGPPTVITRQAKKGEILETLDGVRRELDPFTVLVTDTAGALSIAGIIGGAETEVTDETTAVLLEAANWNYINVRQTLLAQRQRGEEVETEAAARFSRGVHPAVVLPALNRATELMRQLGDGEVAQGVVDNYPRPPEPVSVDLPMSEVERILGIALSAQEVADILTALEFGVERIDEATLRVTAPDHRLDIGIAPDSPHQDIAEIIAQADLIEEIARIYGYDRIPDELIADVLPPQRGNPSLAREERARDVLVNAGLQEVVTHRLTTPESETRLTPPGAASQWPDVGYVTLANPISQDKRVMRHTLLAGVLAIMRENARWSDRQALFEVGNVFLPVEGQSLPEEPRRLCIALTGPRSLPGWQPHDSGEMDYYDLKGIVERLVQAMGLSQVSFQPTEHSTFHPGRVAALMVGGQAVGVLGELHPFVAESFGLTGHPVMAAELDMEKLLAAAPTAHRVEPVSRYEAVYQDIAVVVSEATPAAGVEAAIRQAGGDLLRAVQLFDVYRGEQIGPGKKSLAYALTFQADDRTLREKDATKMRDKIVSALGKKLDAKLRE
jgi:phenylalanyl-tRNA synthetase beta chain